MINYYFDNTNELKPFTHKLEASDNTAPPDNALRVAPVFKDGHWPCVQNGEWALIEDNRGKTVYNVETRMPVEVDYFGAIHNGFTLLRPFEFCKWDGEKWVLDEEAQQNHKNKKNPIYIVESYKNGDSWYNVYSNGFIEQSSVILAKTPTANAVCGTLINLLIPMKTANYGVSIDKINNGVWGDTDYAYAELDLTAFWLASHSHLVNESLVRWTVRGY
jgi:hypothetical protein